MATNNLMVFSGRSNGKKFNKVFFRRKATVPCFFVPPPPSWGTKTRRQGRNYWHPFSSAITVTISHGGNEVEEEPRKRGAEKIDGPEECSSAFLFSLFSEIHCSSLFFFNQVLSFLISSKSFPHSRPPIWLSKFLQSVTELIWYFVGCIKFTKIGGGLEFETEGEIKWD